MRGSVCTCYIHTGSAKIARARARTCIGDVLLTATRSSTHLADAKRGCPSLSSRKSTPHSTQGYRWAHASHTQLRREREMALGESGEAARGPRAGCHRTCEIAASRRGSTESSAPQKPIHDSRRPSAIDDFLFFWVREPSVARGRVKWIGPHFVPRSGPIYKPVRRGDYCFPVGRLCFTKWRQTPGIGTQVPQRSREGKTERTGRAQPR
jgi:hypothetical protein